MASPAFAAAGAGVAVFLAQRDEKLGAVATGAAAAAGALSGYALWQYLSSDGAGRALRTFDSILGREVEHRVMDLCGGEASLSLRLAARACSDDEDGGVEHLRRICKKKGVSSAEDPAKTQLPRLWKKMSQKARMSALSLDYAALGGNDMSGAAALCALLEVIAAGSAPTGEVPNLPDLTMQTLQSSWKEAAAKNYFDAEFCNIIVKEHPELKELLQSSLLRGRNIINIIGFLVQLLQGKRIQHFQRICHAVAVASHMAGLRLLHLARVKYALVDIMTKVAERQTLNSKAVNRAWHAFFYAFGAVAAPYLVTEDRIEEVAAATASALPTPGGGPHAAIASVHGTALLEMCLRISSPKGESIPADLLPKLQDNSRRLIQCARDDANVYCGFLAAGDLDEAIVLLSDSGKAICEQMGDSHPQAMQCTGSLGLAYAAKGEKKKAAELQKQLTAQLKRVSAKQLTGVYSEVVKLELQLQDQLPPIKVRLWRLLCFCARCGFCRRLPLMSLAAGDGLMRKITQMREEKTFPEELIAPWPNNVPTAMFKLLSTSVKRKVAASIAVHPPKYYALIMFLAEWLRCPAAYKAMNIYVVFQYKEDLDLFREAVDCTIPGTPELWVPVVANAPKKGWPKAYSMGNQYIAAYKKYYDGSEAFVTYGRGLLKIFNTGKNFGFISPVFKGEDHEGPPLPSSVDEGIWFFGNHSLPMRASLGVELTFEIWENSQGKAQARSVQVTSEPSAVVPVEQKQEVQHHQAIQHSKRSQNLHPNEPRVIYPSVYVSDVPVEWNEAAIRKLHRQLGLNPDIIMGLKFLPFTEVSLGLAGTKGEKQATPVTGSVILRYVNEEAANAAVERLKGHPIQTSSGVTKHLGAKHATPPKWVVQRKAQEDEAKKITGHHIVDKSQGQKLKTSEGQSQKVSGIVHRVSMAGYGVIKSPEWGEILWRQFELPTNLRCLQFTDRAKFVGQVEHREEYRRLKDSRYLRDLESCSSQEPPSFPPVGMLPFGPGMPPFMDPSFAMMGMPPPWAMGRKEKKKDKKDKKDRGKSWELTPQTGLAGLAAMMDIGKEEYGLMMDSEIGIYAMRAEASSDEACGADGTWSKLLNRIQAFERRKVWPGARVSPTLTTYDFGSFKKSGRDYDLHLLRENARYLVEKGRCQPGHPCQKVENQLKKVIWTWWTELPIVRLDVAKRMLVQLSRQSGPGPISWRAVTQNIFFPRFEHVVYQMWCMLYEGWDIQDVTNITLEAKWGSYLEDPQENSELAKLRPMWVSSEALSKAQSGKIMALSKEEPPLILFHVDMLDLRYSAGGHDYKVLWEDLVLAFLKVHNRTGRIDGTGKTWQDTY
eukprot:s1780_g10.t1